MFTIRRMDKSWYNHSMEYYTAMKITDLQLHNENTDESHKHNAKQKKPEEKKNHT